MSSIGLAVFQNKALQESAVNNAINISNNSNESKIKVITIVRKKQKVQSPQTVSVTSLVKATANSVRPAKRARSKDSSSENESVRNPAPLAVARRNARERNRVRQVNNGFAELRRHIPEEVAEAFENANCNRGPNKKLSKVETLRMAVEYIRSLESLLNLGSDKENTSHSFPSPASSSPGDQSMENSLFSMNSPTFDDDGYDEDELDSLPPIAPHHYTRISSVESFPLSATPVMYEDDDTAQPLTPSSDLVAENQFSMDLNYQLVHTNEHFCVIRNEDSDVLQVGPREIELKYSESVELGGVPDGSILLSDINSLSSQIFIHHAELNGYSVVHKDGTASLDSASFDDPDDLKQEIPELDVTPEDRKQFEETLKWWQEKTQIQAPDVKTVM